MADDTARAPAATCSFSYSMPPDASQSAPFLSASAPALPFLSFPAPRMELFDPDVHLARNVPAHQEHCGTADSLPLVRAARGNPGLTLIPRPEDCHALWDRYAMLDNIRAHSAKVAELAHAMSLLARDRGMTVNPDAVLASGLLHDLAKTYTITYGGNHAQLGSAWVMRETRNAPVAQAVLFHVHWPWQEHMDEDALFLVLSIVYADKRVKHDAYVGLDERFDDLVERYGVSEAVRTRIAFSLRQGKRIETALSRRLEVSLHEHIADHGRLVKRA